MKKTRRTEKTVEIHEFYAIRTASGALPKLCTDCTTGDAIMLAPEHAALLAQVPTRMIYRLVDASAIHYLESPGGSLLVCVRSLVALPGPQASSPAPGDQDEPENNSDPKY